MKRTLVVATLCMLLLATIGTTVASANTWTSPFYTFDVKSDTGRVVGKVVVNMMNPAAPTYSFYGYLLKPGMRYYLYYTTDTVRHDVGSAVANRWGMIYKNGAWTNPVADLKAHPTFKLTTTPRPPPVKASFILTFNGYGYDNYGNAYSNWNVDPRSSSGPITGGELVCTWYGKWIPSDTPGTQEYKYSLTVPLTYGISFAPMMIPWNTKMTATLTVWDAAGHVDTITETMVAGYSP